MRSEVVFRAEKIIGNRYELCQSVAKASRMLSISSRDIQRTIQQAFERAASRVLFNRGLEVQKSQAIR